MKTHRLPNTLVQISLFKILKANNSDGFCNSDGFFELIASRRRHDV